MAFERYQLGNRNGVPVAMCHTRRKCARRIEWVSAMAQSNAMSDRAYVWLADFLPILLAAAHITVIDTCSPSKNEHKTVMQLIYSYFVLKPARSSLFSLSRSFVLFSLFIVRIHLFIYIVMNAWFMLKFAWCLILFNVLFFSVHGFRNHTYRCMRPVNNK